MTKIFISEQMIAGRIVSHGQITIATMAGGLLMHVAIWGYLFLW